MMLYPAHPLTHNHTSSEVVLPAGIQSSPEVSYVNKNLSTGILQINRLYFRTSIFKNIEYLEQWIYIERFGFDFTDRLRPRRNGFVSKIIVQNQLLPIGVLTKNNLLKKLLNYRWANVNRVLNYKKLNVFQTYYCVCYWKKRFELSSKKHFICLRRSTKKTQTSKQVHMMFFSRSFHCYRLFATEKCRFLIFHLKTRMFNEKIPSSNWGSIDSFHVL